ncbi:MAG: triosephosphate isomerase [Microcella sp.]|uniref:triose-phosphate isomerase family protein n=1 Tax=Microcella sp. TaxID=1913979 RepID=UPI0024CA6A85|nr:triose-phosphate isomerase family protein [Microcella sp.]UYN83180.1 MAG: triosephosphate isomerase [Microcella sp.]
MSASTLIGFSSKMYFSHARMLEWARTVAETCAEHPALTSRAAELFVLPSAPSIDAVSSILRGTGIAWGAQHCHPDDSGAHTGDISAAVLAELGCSFVEVGHAERRRDHGEGDELVARTTAAVLRNGMVPVLCLGETEQTTATAAAEVVLAQVDAALADAPEGRVVVAYEPVWAIGAPQPAPDAHIRAVVAAVRSALSATEARRGSAVIYGGSANPGLLTRLSDGVDGLFLGRFAHDPAAIRAILDEAGARV